MLGRPASQALDFVEISIGGVNQLRCDVDQSQERERAEGHINEKRKSDRPIDTIAADVSYSDVLVESQTRRE